MKAISVGSSGPAKPALAASWPKAASGSGLCSAAPTMARIASLSSFYRYLQGAASELRLPITGPNPAHAQFIARGATVPGVELQDASTGGIRLAPFHDRAGDVPAAVRSRLAEALAGLADGSIVPDVTVDGQ